MCVCVYVCMYVCMYVRYVCMYDDDGLIYPPHVPTYTRLQHAGHLERDELRRDIITQVSEIDCVTHIGESTHLPTYRPIYVPTHLQ